MRQDVKNNLLLFPLNEVAQGVQSDKGWTQIEPSIEVNTKIKYDVVGVDFESVVDKDLTLRKMSTWEYVSSPAFESYLVSLVWFAHEDQTFWVWTGKPEDAPWEEVIDKIWVSHNASFDELVFKRLIHDQGFKFKCPDKWMCTLDMCRFFQMRGSLDYACKMLLGMTINKETLQKMFRGTATDEESRNYVFEDSLGTCLLWLHYYKEWPRQEMFVSVRQRRANYRGFGFDLDLSKKGKSQMMGIMSKQMSEIPWAGAKSPTSKKEFGICCTRADIFPPQSMSIDDPLTQAWMRKHTTHAPILEAVSEYSKANQIFNTLSQLEGKIRKDGTIPFEMKYCQAPHTARFQSAKGIRMQNLNSSDFHGFNLRYTYTPRKGKSFIVYDLGQIEPRVLAWAAGDKRFLDLCRQGISPYEVHARAYMGYNSDEKLKHKSPQLYALAKARTLALGYQAWAPRFCEMAEQMCKLQLREKEQVVQTKSGEFITFDKAKKTLPIKELQKLYVFPSGVESVLDFREKNKLIVDFWAEQEEAMEDHIGENYFVPLPAGGNIRYYDVYRDDTDHLRAWIVKGSPNPKFHRDFYGGKLTENYVQRVSRDVLVDRIHAILTEIPYIDICWTVHDEVLFECDEGIADETAKLVEQIFTQSPSWATDLPLAVEGGVTNHYMK